LRYVNCFKRIYIHTYIHTYIYRLLFFYVRDMKPARYRQLTAVFNSRPRNELRSERHRGEKRKTLSNESRAYGEERRPVFIRVTRRRAASRRQQFRSLGIWRSADNRVGPHHGDVARPYSIIVYSRPRRWPNAIAVGCRRSRVAASVH